MKIKRLHIYGFGKWQDQVIELEEGLNSFQGQNEAGKSTIYHFIQSIFFGFPKKTKKNLQNTYQPKQGKVYGGRLDLVDTPYGNLTLERQKVGRKEEVHIFDDQGKEKEASLLADLLYHLDLDIYQQFFALTHQQLRGLSDLNEEDLSRYFLTVGSGTNDALFAWKGKLQEEADKLYRPSGVKLPLNQALSQLESQAQRVEDLAQKEVGYRELVEAIETQQADLEQVQTGLSSKLKQQQNQAKLLELYPLYQDYLALQGIKDGAEQGLSTEILEAYDSLLAKKKVLEDQNLLASAQLEDVKVSDDLAWYQASENYIKALQVKQADLPDLIQDYQYTAYRAQEIFKQLEADLADQPLQVEDLAQLPSLDKKSLDLLRRDQALTADLADKDQAQGLAWANLEAAKNQYQEAQAQVDRKKQGEGQATKGKEKDKLAPVLALMALATGLILFLRLAENQSPLLALITLILAGLAFWRFKGGSKLETNLKSDQEADQIRLQVLAEQLGLQQASYERAQAAQAEAQKVWRSHQEDLHQAEKALGLPTGLSLKDLAAYPFDKFKANYEDYLILQRQLDQFAQEASTYLAFCQKGPRELQKVSLVDGFEAEQATNHQQTIKDLQATNHQQTVKNLQAANHQQTIKVLQATYQATADYLSRMAKEAFQFEEAQAHYAKQERELKRLHHDLEGVLETLQGWLLETGSKDLAQLAEKIETSKKLRDQQEQEKWLGQQLAPYLDALAKLESAQALQKDLAEIQEEIGTLQTQQQAITQDLARLQHSKAFMDADGSFEEAQAKLEQLKADVRDLMTQVGQKLVTSQMITYLLSDGKSQEVSHIFQQALAHLKYLTDGAYQALEVEEEQVRLKSREGIWFQVYELSSGTIDQFYLALRLAFLEAVADRVSLPLMIDDCFVNFDDHRKARVLSLLEKVAQNHQILYFTYDQQPLGHTLKLGDMQGV